MPSFLQCLIKCIIRNKNTEKPIKKHNVYQYFTKGNYIVRRKAGSFKGVNSDTALEQTYNTDVKESGLT